MNYDAQRAVVSALQSPLAVVILTLNEWAGLINAQ